MCVVYSCCGDYISFTIHVHVGAWCIIKHDHRPGIYCFCILLCIVDLYANCRAMHMMMSWELLQTEICMTSVIMTLTLWGPRFFLKVIFTLYNS